MKRMSQAGSNRRLLTLPVAARHSARKDSTACCDQGGHIPLTAFNPAKSLPHAPLGYSHSHVKAP